MDDLNFKNGNPGIVQFGNFINYYKFHPPEQRINLLPTNLWENFTNISALDLGCNAGNLTLDLYKFFTNKVKIEQCNIIGIDIDPVLIQRAKEQNSNSSNIQFHCIDFMNEIQRINFCSSLNINVIFCFSITMWIHLNHGDGGLRLFLKNVSELIRNYLVIEPQPWRCYKTAEKRMKLSGSGFPLFSSLKMRQTVEHDIEQYLVKECNLEKIWESERTEWGRKIFLFKK